MIGALVEVHFDGCRLSSQYSVELLDLGKRHIMVACATMDLNRRLHPGDFHWSHLARVIWHDHVYLARPGSKKHRHPSAKAKPQDTHPARFNNGLPPQIVCASLDVLKDVQIG